MREKGGSGVSEERAADGVARDFCCSRIRRRGRWLLATIGCGAEGMLQGCGTSGAKRTCHELGTIFCRQEGKCE